MSFLAFAFGNPVLYSISRAGVYEAAIWGGQASLLGGLVLAFDAAWDAQMGIRRHGALVAAGTIWAMGVASRLSVAPGVVLLALATALATGWFPTRRWGSLLRDLALMGVPLALGAIGLLAYNKLRFDSWLDFGTGKQLTTLPVLALSFPYVLPNIYSYLLRPAEVSCRFPFVIQWWEHGIKSMPAWWNLPKGYYVYEPMMGNLLAAPIMWILPIAPIVACFKAMKLRRTTEGTTARTHDKMYLWCVATFLILGSAPGLMDSGHFHFDNALPPRCQLRLGVAQHSKRVDPVVSCRLQSMGSRFSCHGHYSPCDGDPRDGASLGLPGLLQSNRGQQSDPPRQVRWPISRCK